MPLFSPVLYYFPHRRPLHHPINFNGLKSSADTQLNQPLTINIYLSNYAIYSSLSIDYHMLYIIPIALTIYCG